MNRAKMYAKPALSRPRVAFVNTHPIQYFAPMYRYLSQKTNLSITALYLSDYSIRGAKDREFGRDVKWDIDLLSGYEVRFVSGAAKRGQHSGLFSMIAPSIAKEVIDGRYDALIIHGHSPVAHVLAALASKASGTPFFFRGETHLGLKVNTVKRILRKPAIKMLYGAADGVMAIGTANAKFYSEMGIPQSNVYSMPYTIDNERFAIESGCTDDERRNLRREMGVFDDNPIVLFVGKLYPRKRPSDLIDAANALTARGSKCHFVFVGTGESETELKKSVADRQLKNVHFVGFVNQTRLPKFYGASDIFVIPSEQEPWGLVVNEAMCAGLPIVSSDQVGCAADLVRDDINGQIFPAGDIDRLVRALNPLIESPELRRKMGNSSRKIISQWSYAECAKGLLHMLSGVSRCSNN